MNWELIKHKFCRLVVTASLLLGGVMVSAAASGTMPLWAALLGLFAAVVMLNAACGILLGTPAAEPRRAVPARTSRPAAEGDSPCVAIFNKFTASQTIINLLNCEVFKNFPD